MDTPTRIVSWQCQVESTFRKQYETHVVNTLEDANSITSYSNYEQRNAKQNRTFEMFFPPPLESIDTHHPV